VSPSLQLRLNKVSELIHNSTHHQNLPYAEVSVYFQMIIDVVSTCFHEMRLWCFQDNQAASLEIWFNGAPHWHSPGLSQTQAE
jgi:hypothetical protein